MTGALVGLAFAALASVALAVASLAVRRATEDHAVARIVAVMYAVNLVVLVPVAVVAGFPRYGVTPRALVAFAVAGLVGSLAARFVYFAAIARIGASRTEPLKALFPVVAVVGAVLLLGETVTSWLAAGIALVLAGTLGVVLEARESPVVAEGRGFWRDLALPLTAALLLGVDPLFTKVGLAEGTPALVGVALRMTAAATGFAVYLVVVDVYRGRTPSPSTSLGALRPDRWLLLASLANTSYLLLYYAALARAPVAVVTPVLGTSTLLVVVGAAVFLQERERVTWRLAAAATVVVTGIVLVVGAS